MNEWEIQHLLTLNWRQNKFDFNSEKYDLVCWELMFPSWTICDKHRNWSEKSIDFIFYSETNQTFLVCEIKNIIKGRKDLLSAYCQTIDRTCSFSALYSVERMKSAMQECYRYAIDERGGSIVELPTIEFSSNPKIKMLILAVEFPQKHFIEFDKWNDMDLEQLQSETLKYATNNEFKRFRNLTQSHIDKLSSRRVERLNINLL